LLEKTPDEIFSLYQSGLIFVNWISASLRAPLERIKGARLDLFCEDVDR
jgi:hypothetical protein